MNFYDKWQSNRKDCECRWCSGGFQGTKIIIGGIQIIDWERVIWNDTQLQINETEAQCVNNMPTLADSIKYDIQPTIVYCKFCNLQNEYGAVNQTDGSYICFNCR